MDRDRAVNKILRDLKQFELIKADDEGQVRIHLTRLAVACLEEGINTGNKKKVIQYSKYKTKIQEFNSVIEAEQRTNEKATTIYEAIRMKHTTRKGFIWEYAKDER
jgi:hypothetical protein